MQTLKLDKFFESFERLEFEEKEYVFDIINKKIIEENRRRILKRSKEAVDNFKKGKVRKGTVKDLLEELE